MFEYISKINSCSILGMIILKYEHYIPIIQDYITLTIILDSLLNTVIKI